MKLASVILVLFTTLHTFGNATIPTADKKGSKDSPLLKRYEGSVIVGYEYKAYDELTLPLSKLEPVHGKTVKHGGSAESAYYEPKQKKQLEGARTHIVYLLPAGRSPLEVIRNYQQEVKSSGGKILFECKGQECGGDANFASTGAAGLSEMTLSMFLYPLERLTQEDFDACAMTGRISEQKYTSAELPQADAHVSVLAYTYQSGNCSATIAGRTIAVIDILESKAREQKMVAVKAEDMAQQIASSGSVALYGIYFDFNKADIKPESAPTIEQIGKLLKSDPKLKLLVVGHTDNVGGFTSNMALSQRRAAAVVNELATKYQIARPRLTPVGVSFASPVATNDTEEGRAKNRRVQLVKE
jgi:OmpA-OmpF porin, OOP family